MTADTQVLTLEGGGPDDLFTPVAVAELFSVPLEQVYQMAIPKTKLSAKRLRYRRQDLVAFIRNNIQYPVGYELPRKGA